MTFYLNSYHPLARTAHGRQASEVHGLPPFIDGSIRREPDLEYRTPTISAVCRGGKFAPRLREGDVVVYLTIKGRWGEVEDLHRRLTAVLRVRHRFPSHTLAAEWFRSRGRPLPSNCLVPGNRPEPLTRSKGLHPPPPCGKRLAAHRAWDSRYKRRITNHGDFLVCDCLFRSLGWGAPVALDRHLVDAFGKVPATRNPGELPREQVEAFLRSLGVEVRL